MHNRPDSPGTSILPPLWRRQLMAGVAALALGSTIATQAIAKTYLDAMILYTPGLSHRYNGNANTRINHLISVTNKIYRDSGLDLALRPVHIKQVNYSDTSNADVALDDMTFGRHPAFSDTRRLRDKYHADVVILMRPYSDRHMSCGVAYVNGTTGRRGDLSGDKGYMYSHIAASVCGDYVAAHELGHNLGLGHSHAQNSEGTWNYSVGHGVRGKFVTVMAYQSAYNVDYWSGKVYKFSSPLLDCHGIPCGVDRRTRNNGADAVYTLRHTAPTVAAFYPTLKSPEEDQAAVLRAVENKYNEAQQRMQTLREELKKSHQRFRGYIQSLNNAFPQWRRGQLSYHQAAAQWRSSLTSARAELRTYQQIRQNIARQHRLLRATRIALAEARKNSHSA